MSQTIAESTYSGFLAALASANPTPGGGAVAGVIGATSAALGEMVARYSLGRSDDPEQERSIGAILPELSRARALLLGLADEDAAAYTVLNSAFKVPKSDPTRAESIRTGAATAIQPPLAMLATAADLARLLESLAPISNPNLRSDLAIAASLASCTASAAYWNIRANARLLGASGRALLTGAGASVEEIGARCGSIETACAGNEDPG